MNEKVYEYDAVIQGEENGAGGAYVTFPHDIRAEFGKGRVSVHVTFDGLPYNGSIVNMGVKNDDGSVCYIIGILQEIRVKLGKQPGDSVRVTVRERGAGEKSTVTIPQELTDILTGEDEARSFFDGLADSYKRNYCDWVGGAKQAATRQTRAEKALVMLRNKQKTLKT